MKKILTLKKNYEFKYVLNKGTKYYGNQIIVYIKPNKKASNVLGIAINTKICTAVKRNKLKRLIRENYRLLSPEMKKGYNMVFLWNRNVDPENADFYKIKMDMENIFKKANIL